MSQYTVLVNRFCVSHLTVFFTLFTTYDNWKSRKSAVSYNAAGCVDVWIVSTKKLFLNTAASSFLVEQPDGLGTHSLLKHFDTGDVPKLETFRH